jgi:hypothetical protein
MAAHTSTVAKPAMILRPPSSAHSSNAPFLAAACVAKDTVLSNHETWEVGGWFETDCSPDTRLIGIQLAGTRR